MQKYCFFLNSIQNKLPEVTSDGVIILELCALTRKHW